MYKINSPATIQKSHFSSANLTARQRRLLFRAAHRGIKEMDLILGGYIQENIHKFTDSEITELENIMLLNDRDLLSWITKEVPVPLEQDTALMRKIIQYQLKPST